MVTCVCGGGGGWVGWGCAVVSSQPNLTQRPPSPAARTDGFQPLSSLRMLRHTCGRDVGGVGGGWRAPRLHAACARLAARVHVRVWSRTEGRAVSAHAGVGCGTRGMRAGARKKPAGNDACERRREAVRLGRLRALPARRHAPSGTWWDSPPRTPASPGRRRSPTSCWGGRHIHTQQAASGARKERPALWPAQRGRRGCQRPWRDAGVRSRWRPRRGPSAQRKRLACAPLLARDGTAPLQQVDAAVGQRARLRGAVSGHKARAAADSGRRAPGLPSLLRPTPWRRSLRRSTAASQRLTRGAQLRRVATPLLSALL